MSARQTSDRWRKVWIWRGYPYGGGGGYELVEHERTSKVESMDIVEDMMADVDVEVVERKHDNMVLVKHWINDGTERH
jgi:hypothetical protein